MQFEISFLLVFFISSLRSSVALFWAVFLLFYRKRASRILPLSIMFLFLGLIFLRNSFFRFPSLKQVDVFSPEIFILMIFLAPLMLFYFWSVLGIKKRLGSYLTQYLYFVVAVLFYFFYKMTDEALLPFTYSINDILCCFSHYPWHVIFFLVLVLLFFIQVGTYFIISHKRIISLFIVYRSQNYDLNPLHKLFIINCIFIIYPFLSVIFLFYNNSIAVELLHNILVSAMLTVIAVFNLNLKIALPKTNDETSVNTLHQSIFSLKADSKVKGINLQKSIVDDSQTSHLPHADRDLMCRIRAFLEKDEAFSSPHLTLDDVAAALNSNRSYVSSAINRYCGCNFKQLLIHYRIEAARQLLLNTGLDVQTILEKSGFNSRMSFYRAFKENVSADLSPSEWRNIQNQHKTNKPE